MKGSIKKLKIKNIRMLLRRLIIVVLCVIMYTWGIASCMSMMLKCAILDENNSSVMEDVVTGNLKTVALVLSNEDFYLNNDDSLYTKNDISDYIRTTIEGGYYYNTDSKLFVAPLIDSEKRKIILDFGILDLVLLIISLVIGIVIYKSKLWKRILFWSSFVFVELYFSLGLYSALDVLYHVPDKFGVILFGKAIFVAFVLLIHSIVIFVIDKKKLSVSNNNDECVKRKSLKKIKSKKKN